MIVSLIRSRALDRVLIGAAVLALGAALTGCAGVSDGMTAAFADPAAYDLYDCKQLETERKKLAEKLAELQGLIDKAQTGAGGVVVAEVAYRNELIATRGKARYAEQAWVANKCRETPPSKTAQPVQSTVPPPIDRSGRAPMRSGSAVY